MVKKTLVKEKPETKK